MRRQRCCSADDAAVSERVGNFCGQDRCIVVPLSMKTQEFLNGFGADQRHVSGKNQEVSSEIPQRFPRAHDGMAGAQLFFLVDKCDP